MFLFVRFCICKLANIIAQGYSSFSFQRIEVFVKQNNFLDALELALSFYNGTAMAVIGELTSTRHSTLLNYPVMDTMP